MRRGRRAVRPAVVSLAALAAAAAAAHFAYWYAARERVGRPGAEAAATLLAAGAGGTAVWIAYPHQNLGRLEGSLRDPEAWLAVLGGSDPATRRTLPRFAGFAVPPADGLWLRIDPCGGLRAELEVYPIVSLLARTAGALAGNPWLGGGEVRSGSRGSGTVTWRRGTWRLELNAEAGAGCPPAGAASPAPGGAELPPALAYVRLGSGLEPIPAGLYRLDRRAGELEIHDVARGPAAGAATGGAPEPPAGPGPEDPAGWLAEVDARGGLRALAVWESDAAVAGLPAIVVLDRGRRGFDLPGAELLRLAGERAPEAVVDGIRVSALDRATLERGLHFASVLSAWLAARSERPLTLAAADPSRLEPVVSRLASALGRIPIVGPPRARPFALAAALLEPVRDCRAAGLAVAGDPPSVWLRPCAAGVLGGGRSR